MFEFYHQAYEHHQNCDSLLFWCFSNYKLPSNLRTYLKYNKFLDQVPAVKSGLRKEYQPLPWEKKSAVKWSRIDINSTHQFRRTLVIEFLKLNCCGGKCSKKIGDWGFQRHLKHSKFFHALLTRIDLISLQHINY